MIPHKAKICAACKGTGRRRFVDGPAMRKIRERYGITQEDLAAKIGVSKSYVSDMENGKRPMSEAMAAKIMEICT